MARLPLAVAYSCLPGTMKLSVRLFWKALSSGHTKCRRFEDEARLLHTLSLSHSLSLSLSQSDNPGFHFLHKKKKVRWYFATWSYWVPIGNLYEVLPFWSFLLLLFLHYWNLRHDLWIPLTTSRSPARHDSRTKMDSKPPLPILETPKRTKTLTVDFTQLRPRAAQYCRPN